MQMVFVAHLEGPIRHPPIRHVFSAQQLLEFCVSDAAERHNLCQASLDMLDGCALNVWHEDWDDLR